MTDKQPTQAMGKGIAGDPKLDGGREGGGQDGGGAYKDKDLVKGDPNAGGYMGHGGQSKITYTGTGDAEDGGDNSNAATKNE